MDWDLELVLNRFSMVTLVLGGAYLIYEGVHYISMKKNDPNMPAKIYTAAVLSIVLGVMEIAFAIGHFWF